MADVNVNRDPQAIAKAIILAEPLPILAPYLMALVVDCMLFGVFLSQLSIWVSWSAKKDRQRIKAIVVTVALLVTGATIYLTWLSVKSFVLGFGTDYQLFFVADYVNWLALWDQTTVIVAQIFYVERAYRLNGNRKSILVILVFLILFSWSGCIGGRVLLTPWGPFAIEADAVPNHKASVTFFYIWLASNFAADIILVSLISKGLLKSKTGWSHTDHLVNRLVRMSVETQLPGTLLTLACMIQFSISPASSMTSFFAVVLPKVYAVSLMSVLNARLSFSGALGDQSGSSRPRSNTFRPTTRGTLSSKGRAPSAEGFSEAPIYMQNTYWAEPNGMYELDVEIGRGIGDPLRSGFRDGKMDDLFRLPVPPSPPLCLPMQGRQVEASKSDSHVYYGYTLGYDGGLESGQHHSERQE